MNETSSFNECCSYVAALVQEKTHPEVEQPHPAITISRQTGARGRSIGKKIQDALREGSPQDPIPWTCFDEDLVEKVLNDHDLPASLAKFMPEDSVSEIDSTINEILGRHPSLWTLFEQTVESMVHLCHMGNCILVGRGGNKIAEGLSNVTRVRFVGSLSQRIKQVVSIHGMSNKEAKYFIKQEDRARQRYMKNHFDSDVENPFDYDLVINTDHYSDQAVVQIVLSAVAAKQPG
ncbi:MAG: cytidylate kinase-like family protein [Opitutae bacterium]|nr:cytidylate kinase-like family protein [Opitutae bacterium]